MKWTTADIRNMDRIPRLNLINALSGVKSAQLIGTRSKARQSNLAIFNSLTHIGSNPPLLGLIFRPDGEVRRHTLENIRQTGFYTINTVTVGMVPHAHYTSAKFEANESEFDACGFAETSVDDFPAPFVGESPIRIGMRAVEELPIEINGTTLLIGEVEVVHFDDRININDDHPDLSSVDAAGISGLNTYYRIHREIQMPYARPNEVPPLTSEDEA